MKSAHVKHQRGVLLPQHMLERCRALRHVSYTPQAHARVQFAVIAAQAAARRFLDKLPDPRVDEADQESEGESFCSSTTCCIGVPLVPLRNQVKSAADLASHKKFLRTGFNCARAQTIAEEEGLKRSKVHSSTVSGNPQSLATVCSNHVLSDAVSMHSKLKTMLSKFVVKYRYGFISRYLR